MKRIVYPILFLSLLFSGCSKDDCEPELTNALTPVSFSPLLMGVQQIDTRAVKTTWAAGDKLAIFSDIAVKKDGSTSTASITYTRGAKEGEWASPSADNQWYFANATDEHNFYAYYPVGTATSYTAVEVPDISGQDGTMTLQDLKESNDFMRGAGTATKGSVAASLQMFRVFTIINLDVKLKPSAFVGNDATLTEIKLISDNGLPLVNPSSGVKATVNLSNGTITCSGGLTTATFKPVSGIKLSTAAVSIPIKIYPQKSTIQVQFTVDGKTSAPQPLSISTFVGGRVFSYKITLNAGLNVIGMGDPLILEWLGVEGNPLEPVIPN